MSETMIERVARTLCETRTWPGAWLQANEVERNACLFEARKVIEAMRVPTGTMQADGRDKLREWLPRGELGKTPDHQWHPSNEVYQTMIDAAMSEPSR